MSLVEHAKLEFQAAGWPGDCEMQQLVCDNLIEILATFGSQGHSGSSAHYVLNAFDKLARYKPLVPLTVEDWEWMLLDYQDEVKYQNKRCGRIFKREDGTAYDSEGISHRMPNGSCWLGSYSCVDIEFPYTPETKYIDVDEDGNPLENN